MRLAHAAFPAHFPNALKQRYSAKVFFTRTARKNSLLTKFRTATFHISQPEVVPFRGITLGLMSALRRHVSKSK